jgi:hypothetical protein
MNLNTDENYVRCAKFSCDVDFQLPKPKLRTTTDAGNMQKRNKLIQKTMVIVTYKIE